MSIPSRINARDFQYLSGMRGVAAVVVVLRHLDIKRFLCGYSGLFELGVLAVWVFFVLSAFLLTFRALRDPIPCLSPRSESSNLTVRHKTMDLAYTFAGPLLYWTKYCLRRFFRVWPLYAIVVIAAHLYTPLTDSLWGAFKGDIWTSLLLQDRSRGREMAQFWSLLPEFSYYLCIPFYVMSWKFAESCDGVRRIEPTQHLNAAPPSIFNERYSSRSWKTRTAHLLSSVSICLYCLVYHPLASTEVQHQALTAYMPIFWFVSIPGLLRLNALHRGGTLGAISLHVLLQVGWNVDPNLPAGPYGKRLSWSGDAIALLIIAWTLTTDTLYHTYIYGQLPARNAWSWTVLSDGSIEGPQLAWAAGFIWSIFILALAVLSPRGVVASVLSNSLFLLAGDIGFSIYALHFIIYCTVAPYIGSLYGVDQLLISCLAIGIGATLSYRLIEKPFMAVGNTLCARVDAAVRGPPTFPPHYTLLLPSVEIATDVKA